MMPVYHKVTNCGGDDERQPGVRLGERGDVGLTDKQTK